MPQMWSGCPSTPIMVELRMDTGCRISSTAGEPGSSGTGASMSLTTSSVHAAPLTLALVGAKSCAAALPSHALLSANARLNPPSDA